ncbi:CCA tRNA nucleotidyltransferase, mitochondrial [Lunasporangiospora selenospora]|uniref:CCA tRNA nucleotidyltransferase, mitochondrial n=1 Tax=Lunasporangiospora selenospora TaxID=979761 RepID=A0A9P6G179_9FUNG|nr:CCA tRNA nucleotidyltransferase, mitochondrial [Lunasporangiospora selenospora]
MAIMGVPLDFVNLRSEVYDDSSRIPSEIQFGTPSEDAYRRDTTINALFYNIHTHKVEDFTGRGLDDLRSGLIRTPLEAYETFWQDPLRVLRCIRFASRFHFQLVEDAKKAMLDPRIKEALRTKISKERIGAELEKMIDDGAGRSVGIGLLQELDLYDVVFSAPEVNIQEQPKGTSAVEGPVRDIGEAFKLVWVMEWLLRLNPTDSDEFSRDGVVYTAKRDEGQEALLRATKGQAFTDELFTVVRSEPPQDIPIIASREDQQQQQQKQPKDKQDEEQQQAPPPQQSAPNPEKQAKRSLIFASMLFPYRDMVTSVNKRPVPAAAWILRYGLKARNQDIDAVSKMMDSIKLVQTTVNNVHFGTLASATSLCSETASQDKSPQERVIADERAEIGMAIRDVGSMAVIGAKWPCMFLLGLGIELVSYFEQLHQGTIDYEAKAIIEKYNTFLKKAQMYEVDYAFAWKYIVDGKELTKMLDTRPGPKTNAYLQLVMQWQLRNPRASKEDCQKWIEANKERILTAC